MIFVDIVLPVALIVGIGYLLGRVTGLEARPVANVSLYILSPALIMMSLASSTVAAEDLATMAVAVIVLTIALFLLALAAAYGFGLSAPRRSALLLSTVFSNAANYGFPVIVFALGPEALEPAAVFVVVQAVLMYSLGVIIAALGRQEAQMDISQALRAVASQPAFYAAIAGLLLRVSPLELPLFLARPLDMLAQAGIPMVLVVLGMQLARTKLGEGLADVTLATVLRLVVSPIVALLLMRLLNVPDLVAKVLVIQAATPTAIVVTLLAVEYDALPEVVSSTTLVTTLLSFATITMVLKLLI